MFKRTIALGAILTAGAAGSASAATTPSSITPTPTINPMSIGASSGSVTTPPLNVVGDATVKLGPAGVIELEGIKKLQVTVRWSNALGTVQPLLGTDCTVDTTARINIGQRTAVAVRLSYVRTASPSRRATRVAATRRFDVRALNGGPWDFGVCYG